MKSTDSAVQLLAALLPWGGNLLALVEAYFDESGTHDGAPVLCVAGYIFEREQAQRLSEEWKAVLDSKGLSHFHMIDCAQGANEFAKLSPEERDQVARKIIKIIKENITRGVGALVVPGDYEDLMPPHKNLGGAYNYCLWHCLQGVRLWADEIEYNGDIAYLFESGADGQSEADRIMHFAVNNDKTKKDYRYIAHAFVDKKKSPPVQAADVLAWQMYTDWKHGMVGGKRRKDFDALIDQKNHRVTIMNRETIMGHVSHMIAIGAWLED